MSVLNDLIRIKTSIGEDDIIKMLDEILIYEKLSVNENFRDLKSSEIARSKCPLLAGFVDENPYERILGDLVANIYLQIEGYIPDILTTWVVDRTPKEQKQFEILQAGIAHVEYNDLAEYDHEEMKDHVVAVFTEENQGTIMAAVIVRSHDGYEMYHGSYIVDEENQIMAKTIDPVIVKGHKGVLVMEIYSMLGNNAYPFATYSNKENTYFVMISLDGTLFLMHGDNVAVEYRIPKEDHNKLNIAKKKPEDYAKAVVSIIESVV